MTAINIFVRPGAVHLLTDAAFYGEDAVIVTIASKVAVAASLGMAFAVSGAVSPYGFAALLGRLDGLTAAEIRSTVARVAREHRRALHDDFQLFLATIEAGEPCAWILSTNQAYFGAGYDPYTWAQVDQVVALGLDVPAGFDPARDGAALLERQRRTPWPDGAFCVGGFGELTTVTAAGVRQERMVTWPDRVGERIGFTKLRRQPRLLEGYAPEARYWT